MNTAEDLPDIVLQSVSDFMVSTPAGAEQGATSLVGAADGVNMTLAKPGPASPPAVARGDSEHEQPRQPR